MRALSLVLLAFVLVLRAAPALARPEAPPAGEWHNTDLRAIEVVAASGCIRVWLEERTYHLTPAGDSRFTGVYFNFIRATPAGAPSLRPECNYPPPTENPIASQIRGWTIFGKRTAEGSWRVAAEPGPPAGDFQTYKTEPFETRLSRRGDLLADVSSTANGSGGAGAADGAEDPEHTLLFRPPGPVPAAARSALEETLRQLYGGACLKAMSRLAASEDVAREVCELRQRARQIAGSLLSINVDGADPIDRVPAGFPGPAREGYRRQRAVFFSFDGRFENQTIPGNAIVVEEEGAWRVAMLWF
jgi:hypothetical protein